MKGKLYGVGVGPGDPELLTLKALRIIKGSDIIAVPGEAAQESVAFEIAKGAYPQLAQKECMAIPMPMTKDPEVLKESHEKGAARLEEALQGGKQIAFLTLGDPSVYSTYLYVHTKLLEKGCEAEIISGIPSFCAAAARFGIGLVEKAEPLHVIPASYQIEDALCLPGTKILMKAGRKIKEVKEQLLTMKAQGFMIENCGMENEKIYKTIEEIPENAGYYSLIIVKEEKL